MRRLAVLLLILGLAGFALGDGLDLPIKPTFYKNTTQPRPVKPEQGGGGRDPRDEPPPVFYGEEIESETDTLVYVIDISCSMTEDYISYINFAGERAVGPRIDRAKAELCRSVAALPRNLRFSIIAYSCYTRLWNKQLQQANQANKASAISWVQGLEPTDATATGPAVALGLSLDRDNKTVVLLTDGAPNCGTAREMPHEHREMIRNANTQHAQINVFGIAPREMMRTFCKQVSSDSGGVYRELP